MYHLAVAQRNPCKTWSLTLSLLLLATLLVSRAPAAFAEELTAAEAPSEPADVAGRGTITLEPVVVTAPRVPSVLEQVPAAVTVIPKEDIQLAEPTVTLEESLIRSPGVFVQNQFNYAQDLRISIRGFGARSAFGIRGIQIYVDGIPHTLPDGQSQIDSIDPSAIQQIEVMRGPIAALYGNSSGGVINIITEEGPPEPYVETRQVFGQYGLWKAIVKGGGQSGPVNYFLDVSHLQSDGYREHSEAESWKLNSKVRYDLDDASSLTFLVDSVYSPELKDPGGLTRDQMEADPGQAAATSLKYDTGEKVSDGRMGLKYRRALTESQNIEAVGYFDLRHLDNAIPYRFVELDRNDFGGRLQYDISGRLLGISQQLFAGVEVQQQNDDRKNFDNIDGSAGSTVLLKQNEYVTNIGAFLQEDIKLTDKWSVVLGGRYDNVRFEVDDRLLSDGDDSGSKTFDQLTGRAGLNYLLRPDLQLYANVAQSFETPTTTEVVNRPEGGGGINPNIEPQKAINYEVGFKGIVGRRFTYEAALFYIQLEDELIAFRDSTDRVFYRNAGKSRRYGAELGAGLEITRGLKAHLAYTYLNAQFEDYNKGGSNLDGNEVPGLPRHQLFAEILYEHPWGFYAGTDVLFVSDLYVNDENTQESSAYTVVNLRGGIKKSFGRWQISPFLGVENLLDESYSGNVRINATGNRYFEPAPGINVYAGLGIRYQW